MTDTETLIIQTAARIPAIVADVADSDAARVELHAAEAALLDRLVALLRPALRALGTRPLIADRSSGGDNGCHPWQETERATWRGICVYNDSEPGPSRDRRGDPNTGSYGSEDLFLVEDGTWRCLTYHGSWSNWHGATSKWKATETRLTTAEMAANYDIDDIVQNLSVVVARAGSRAEATKASRERAAKIQAIVALVMS